MENIILDSVRLIATDDASSKIVERLRSEGIYGQEDNQWQLMNIVLVSSAEGVVNIPNVLSRNTPAKRNIIIKTNQSLEIDDNLDYYSILSFFNDADVYQEITALLCFIRTNVKMNGVMGIDENDFFGVIKGRNMISTHSYSFNTHVDEAIDKIKKIKLQDNGKYLLLFTYEHNNEETALDIVPVKNYLETFPENATVYWNIQESSANQVTLFTSISI